MLRVGFAAADLRKLRPSSRLLRLAALIVGLAICVPSIAQADDDEVRPIPRTSVIIGGASVTLIATLDHLYAFVDRVEDNAPLADAELSIDTDQGESIPLTKAPISLNRATEGLFVGPLKRVGRQQDAFMVSLQSAAGNGDAPAEIIYTDVIVNPANIPPPAMTTGTKLTIAGMSGGIGAICTALLMLWSRGGWRRKQGAANPVAITRAV